MPFVPGSPGLGDATRWGYAFDESRGVVMAVVGGSDLPLHTYQWDGSSWTMLDDSGPPPRRSFSMTYDPLRDRLVLFGGRETSLGPERNDTWEWDGSSWSLRATTGPSPRFGAGFVFDESRGKAILAGGGTGSGSNFQGAHDTWEWDGTNWTLLSATQPSGDIDSSDGFPIIYDPIRQAPIHFRSGVQIWDGTSWVHLGHTPFVTGGAAPPILSVFDRQREVVVIWAPGSSGTELWEWDGVEFHRRFGGPKPTPRSIVYHAKLGSTLFLGSFGVLLEWTGAGYSQRNGISIPNEAVYDSVRDLVVSFGSISGTRVWDGTTLTTTFAGSPMARDDRGMAFDSTRAAVVMFGGIDYENNCLGDTWEWTGSPTWSLRSTTGPSPRAGHGMTFDAKRHVTVLFGGRTTAGTKLQDTWEWNGATWRRAATSGPAARSHHSLTYYPPRGTSLLIGGETANGAAPDEVWEWNGVSWARWQMPAAPTGVSRNFAVYNALRNELIVVSDPLDRFWVLGPFTTDGARPEGYPTCAGTYAPKNRYLSFVPPAPYPGVSGIAFRVTLTQMPGPSDCPSVQDLSSFTGETMWVGEEALVGGSIRTGIHRLQGTPLYRTWPVIPGGVVHVADCNIVPCATYTIEAVDEFGNSYAALELSTSSVWADITGSMGGSDGAVNALDVVGVVNRFRGVSTAPAATRCDLIGANPVQGVLIPIDALDITAVVDAFRGKPYPFSGPSAPNNCPP